MPNTIKKIAFFATLSAAALSHSNATDQEKIEIGRPEVKHHYCFSSLEGESVEISVKDYKDQTGTLVSSLKNNHNVVHLTIHSPNWDSYWTSSTSSEEPFGGFDDAKYNNDMLKHEEIIVEGLQNKPLLETLTIIGDFNVVMFLQPRRFFGEQFSGSIGQKKIDSTKFLELPHLECFKYLRELTTGKLIGAQRNDNYFRYKIIPLMTKLQKFDGVERKVKKSAPNQG